MTTPRVVAHWFRVPTFHIPRWAWALIALTAAIIIFAIVRSVDSSSPSAPQQPVASAAASSSADKPVPVAQSQQQTAASSAVTSQGPSVPAGVLVFENVGELVEAGAWSLGVGYGIPRGTVVQVGGTTKLFEKTAFLNSEVFSIVDLSQGYKQEANCYSPGAGRPSSKLPLHNTEGIRNGQWVIVRGEYDGPPMPTSPRSLLNCTIVSR